MQLISIRACFACVDALTDSLRTGSDTPASRLCGISPATRLTPGRVARTHIGFARTATHPVTVSRDVPDPAASAIARTAAPPTAPETAPNANSLNAPADVRLLQSRLRQLGAQPVTHLACFGAGGLLPQLRFHRGARFAPLTPNERQLNLIS
jgi:hypothetical protein